MHHPFAELIGFTQETSDTGRSLFRIDIQAAHLNPHRVVHGAVLYALADTGMGAALYPSLAADELCATIQITMNYFKAVHEGGQVRCETELVSRGKRVANLHSRLYHEDRLVATADGNYAIFSPSNNRSSES